MKHRTSSSTKPQSSKYQPYSSKMNQDNYSRGDSGHRSERRNTYLNMMELNSDSYHHGHRRNVFRYKVSLYLGFLDSLTP